MRYEYCVLGNGLIGASVALELAGKSGGVCVLGAAYGDERKYYSGHEDDSRLLRCWHSDSFWEDLTRRNLRLIECLSAETGVDFFRSAPVLYRCAPGFALQGPSARPRSFRGGGPVFAGFDFEDAAGGIVEPKLYIAALNQRAKERGAAVVRCTISGLCRRDGSAKIITSAGEFEARRVVDARGIYFQESGVRMEAEVIGKVLIYAESSGEGDDGPLCFVDSQCDPEVFHDMYGFWNYRPAAGATVSKFGFTERTPVKLQGTGQIAGWFHEDYRGYPYLEKGLAAVKKMYGSRRFTVRIKPCAFTATTGKRPEFVLERGYGAIVGCNGMAAKCCQALAELFVDRWNT